MLFEALKETPPSEVMACAERPAGFSDKAWAVIPPEVRTKLVEVLTAFRANGDRHDRLVNYLKPGSCPAQH